MTPLEKRQKARESLVEAGGHSYTLRRPTARQMASFAGATQFDVVRQCVVGWTLTGADLYPGGDATPEPFDADLWADWLADNPDLWKPLWDGIASSIAAHDARLEAAAKN